MAKPPEPAISPGHLQYLQARGVTEANALSAGLHSRGAALRVPWHYPTSRRKRAPETRIQTLLFGKSGIPAKRWPDGRTNSLAVHPDARDNLVVDDAGDNALILVEGHTRMLALWEYSIPALALNGCWGWSQGNQWRIDDFEAVRRKHPDVAVIYVYLDADLATNEGVYDSAAKGAWHYLQVWPDAEIVYKRVPTLSEDVHTGLDDYLAAKGYEDPVEAFEALMGFDEVPVKPIPHPSAGFPQSKSQALEFYPDLFIERYRVVAVEEYPDYFMFYDPDARYWKWARVATSTSANVIARKLMRDLLTEPIDYLPEEIEKLRRSLVNDIPHLLRNVTVREMPVVRRVDIDNMHERQLWPVANGYVDTSGVPALRRDDEVRDLYHTWRFQYAFLPTLPPEPRCCAVIREHWGDEVYDLFLYEVAEHAFHRGQPNHDFRDMIQLVGGSNAGKSSMMQGLRECMRTTDGGSMVQVIRDVALRPVDGNVTTPILPLTRALIAWLDEAENAFALPDYETIKMLVDAEVLFTAEKYDPGSEKRVTATIVRTANSLLSMNYGNSSLANRMRLIPVPYSDVPMERRDRAVEAEMRSPATAQYLLTLLFQATTWEDLDGLEVAAVRDAWAKAPH